MLPSSAISKKMHFACGGLLEIKDDGKRIDPQCRIFVAEVRALRAYGRGTCRSISGTDRGTWRERRLFSQIRARKGAGGFGAQADARRRKPIRASWTTSC